MTSSKTRSAEDKWIKWSCSESQKVLSWQFQKFLTTDTGEIHIQKPSIHVPQ